MPRSALLLLVPVAAVVVLLLVGGVVGENKERQMQMQLLLQQQKVPSNVVCRDDLERVQTPESCNTCLDCCFSEFSEQSRCEMCYAENCTMPTIPVPMYMQPTIHFSPPALHMYGWHDVAGTITHNGVHHVFMGGDGLLGGWAHFATSDLVHWKFVPGAPRRVDEYHAGMHSYNPPCSGFVTLDDHGVPCAGFRQCGSSQGVYGGQPWDVPVEIRCAKDNNLTQWGEAEYLFDVFFYRALPYDPARPWKDEDGKWYALISTDGCNATVHKLPCEAGGRADMWSSPALRGPKADWKYVGPMFETNRTVLQGAHLEYEFVTIDYVGGFKGDPAGGHTRVFFNNVGGNPGFPQERCCGGTTGFYVGKQKNGSPFKIDWTKDYSVGMVDWGAFAVDTHKAGAGETGIGALEGTQFRGVSMARMMSVSEDSNLVIASSSGRRVMIGWISVQVFTIGAVSTPRDMTMDEDYNLLQQFVPEMQMLRNPSRHSHVVLDQPSPYGPESSVWSQQAEIFATFTFDPTATTNSSNGLPDEFGIAVFGSHDGNERTLIGVRPALQVVLVDSTTQGNSPARAGPLLYPANSRDGGANVVHLHAIIDHGIIEVIFNNRTAITVVAVPTSIFSNRIWFYGIDGANVQATIDVWELEAANNVLL